MKREAFQTLQMTFHVKNKGKKKLDFFLVRNRKRTILIEEKSITLHD